MLRLWPSVPPREGHGHKQAILHTHPTRHNILAHGSTDDLLLFCRVLTAHYQKNTHGQRQVR